MSCYSLHANTDDSRGGISEGDVVRTCGRLATLLWMQRDRTKEEWYNLSAK